MPSSHLFGLLLTPDNREPRTVARRRFGVLFSLLIEFWIVGEESPVTIRVAESGSPSMPVPVAEQSAQYEQDTRTWQDHLELARDRPSA